MRVWVVKESSRFSSLVCDSGYLLLASWFSHTTNKNGVRAVCSSERHRGERPCQCRGGTKGRVAAGKVAITHPEDWRM